jgi:hypothetical protein
MQWDDAHRRQELLWKVVGDDEDAATAAIDEIMYMVDAAMPPSYESGQEDERVERLACTLEVTAWLGQALDASLRSADGADRSRALLRRLTRWIAMVGPAIKKVEADECSLNVGIGVVSVGVTWTTKP